MANGDEPIWITEAEAVSLVDLGEAISVTHQVFTEQAAGRAQNLTKTQAKIGATTLHATGGALRDGGYVGTKSWSHTPGGATPIVLLWDIDDGSLLAVIEAHALGQYRTAAVSAVATAALAAPDAATMALLGTGSQALIQLAAVNCVRRLEHVSVWSPREESRTAMVKRVRDALQIECDAAATVDAAVDGAAVITLVTRATEPFLRACAPASGAHLNALGAIGLDRAEFEPELLRRCATVAVDDLPAAQASSRELRDYFGAGTGEAWSAVRPLAQMVAAPPVRPEGTDLTLLKAMGTGLADLAIARFIYEQARENGLGRAIPRPTRSKPRLRSSLQRMGAQHG